MFSSHSFHIIDQTEKKIYTNVIHIHVHAMISTTIYRPVFWNQLNTTSDGEKQKKKKKINS
jgi:hypothetical protein